MPTPKFNFIPERQLGEIQSGNGYWTASILASNNALYLSADMVDALEMDGKYYRIFADTEKKAIGWLETKGPDLNSLNDARQARMNKQSGAVLFGVGKILKALNYDLKETIKGLRVNVYKSPLVDGDISYVILPSIEHGKDKEKKASDSK